MKGGKAKRTSEKFSQSTVEIVPETNLLLYKPINICYYLI